MTTAIITRKIKTNAHFARQMAEKRFIISFAFLLICHLLIFPLAVHAREPVLSVAPALLNVSETSGTVSFEVENTGTGVMDWTALEDADWFSVSPDMGTDSSTVTVTYDANPGEARTGTIIISSDGAANSPRTVSISQSGNPFIQPGSTINAVYSGSETWYPLNLVSGQGVAIVLDAHLDRGHLNFSLYDAHGNKIAGSDVIGIDDGETGKSDITAILSNVCNIKVWGTSDAAGNYDLTVYNAWFNPGITDSDRGFYSTQNTSKYIEEGNYELSSFNQDWYRFVAESGENITVSTDASLSAGKLIAELYDQHGNLMAETGDIFNGESGTVSHGVAVGGVYYLKVRGYDDAAGTYHITSSASPGQNTDDDGDGLYKDAEYHHGTNPGNPDTDGDGISDPDEAAQGRSPTHEYPTVDVSGAVNKATAIEVPFFNTPFNTDHSGQDTWYSLELKRGQGISAGLTPHIRTGKLRLFLYDQKDNRITQSAYADNNNTKTLSHTAVTGGKYYFRVSAYDGACGNYDFSVYSVWFSPGITDTSRNFCLTQETSCYIRNSSYKVDQHNEVFYRFIVQNNEETEITVTPHINLGELRLTLYDQNGDEIANTGRISNGESGTLRNTITVGGICYAGIASFNGAYGNYDLATSADPARNTDTDGDGLYDAAEYHHGTDPRDTDTDGDGISDSNEAAQGRNPTREDNTLVADGATSAADAVVIPFFNKVFSTDHISTDTWYSVNLVSGQGVTIMLSPHINNGKLKLSLHNQHENKISQTDYIFNGDTRMISHIAVTGGTYYVRVADYDNSYGNYDLAVYSAWFNPGITDSGRNFYSTLHTSRYLANGNYKISPYNEDDYRFVAKDGEEITITATAGINRGKLRLFLYDRNMDEIVSSDYFSNGETKTVIHTVTIGEVCYLSVRSYDKAYGNYDLTLSADPGQNTDTDHDGLYDAAEYHHRTDPANTDTDGDGISDTEELTRGRNPTHDYLSLITGDNSATETATVIPFFDKPFNAEHSPDIGAWYSLDLARGQGITAMVTARLNRGMLKLSLHDQHGDKIADTSYIYNGETKTADHTAMTGGTYYLRVSDYESGHGNYDLAVYNACFNAGVEDTDREFFSTQYTSKYILSGSFELSSYNEDHYRFGVLKGKEIEITVSARINRGKLRLHLYNEKGYDVAFTDFIYNGETRTLSHTVASTGMYYVSVRAYDGAYGKYDLTVLPWLEQKTDFVAVSGKTAYFRNGTPVPNVSVNLEGPDSYSGTTDEKGEYDISGIFPGDYTSAQSKDDDTEGLSGTDASRIARHAAGLYALDCHEKIAADLDGDGSVSAQDALSAARYAAGLTDCFNSECDNWVFIPDPIDICNSWPPISYLPGKTYAQLDSDMENENFLGIRLGDVTGNWVPDSALLLGVSSPGMPSEQAEHARAMPEIITDPGSALKIPIFSDQNTYIEGIDIVAEFDEKVLDATGATLSGGILENRNYELQTNTGANGRVRLVAYATENVFTGTGELGSVYFKVVGNIFSSSVLSITKFEANELPGGGKFYINGATADKVRITVRPGDTDQSGTIDLGDAILVLKVLSGISTGTINIASDADRDGRLGIENAVYVLQYLANMR